MHTIGPKTNTFYNTKISLKDRVDIQSAMKTFNFNDPREQPRFDQTPQPFYPAFDKEGKYDTLIHHGWGIAMHRDMKYKPKHYMHKDFNRNNLKSMDKFNASKFPGSPSGHLEEKGPSDFLDIGPDVYNVMVPTE